MLLKADHQLALLPIDQGITNEPIRQSQDCNADALHTRCGAYRLQMSLTKN
jgi:hypothetical protein